MKAVAKLVVLLPLLWAVEAATGDAARGDLQKLQGTWRAESVVENGQEVPEKDVKTVTITFQGDKATLQKEDEKGLEVGVKIDPSKTPRHMDWTLGKGGEKGLGIYELNGDTLKICMSRKGKEERPTEFTSPPSSGRMVAVLKRAKS